MLCELFAFISFIISFTVLLVNCLCDPRYFYLWYFSQNISLNWNLIFPWFCCHILCKPSVFPFISLWVSVVFFISLYSDTVSFVLFFLFCVSYQQNHSLLNFTLDSACLGAAAAISLVFFHLPLFYLSNVAFHLSLLFIQPTCECASSLGSTSLN